MDIDITRHLGAVDRTVAQREHNGRPARLIALTRSYDTDIADLWDAITTAERLARWFQPVTGDLKLGGRFQIKDNASGEITTCDAPERLEVTWEMHNDTSWVTVTLKAIDDDKTQLRLEHLAHVPDEFWTQYGPGAVGVGWDLGVLGLAEHLRAPDSFDAEQAQQWPLTDEGKLFVAGCSEDWGKAAIAGGETQQQAQAAAEQVRRFYTGELAPTGEG